MLDAMSMLYPEASKQILATSLEQEFFSEKIDTIFAFSVDSTIMKNGL